MTDLDNLRSRIHMMLSSQRIKRAEKQQEIEESMGARGRQQDHFVEVAAKIFEGIVEPRLKLLEEQLKDAGYQRSSETRGVVTLNRERCYAAAISLEMGIQCDQKTRNLVVNYHLQILPILMDYRGQDSLVLPLESVDDTRVASFVEEKLVECVQTYLKLQDIPAYRKSIFRRDPVCGMVIQSDDVISVVHDGKTYLFCSEVCRSRFLEQPSRYAAEQA
jgi:YHS domain-containing protein